MNIMLWYYIWSPKYEIFHGIMQSCIIKNKGFELNPIFVPQEIFSNTYQSNTDHFLCGNNIQMECTAEALKLHPNEHIIFSDVDLIVNTKHIEKLYDYMQTYKKFDMVFMKDNFIDDTRNIGLCLIKSTPETIVFFKNVSKEIIRSNSQNQKIVNDFLPSFTGTHSIFSFPEIIQSNMATNETLDFYVLQMLCSQKTADENIGEKLASAAKFINIKEGLHLISPITRQYLRDYYIQFNQPNHFSHFLSEI